jgi:hypothetical protein
VFFEQLYDVPHGVALAVCISNLHDKSDAYTVSNFFKLVHREHNLHAIANGYGLLHRERVPVAISHRVCELQPERVLFEQLYDVPHGFALTVGLRDVFHEPHPDSVSDFFQLIHSQRFLAIANFFGLLYRERIPIAVAHRVLELQPERVLFEQLYCVID